MAKELTSAFLSHVAADLGWPRIEMGTLTVEGREMWEWALARSSAASERIDVVVGLGPALLAATPGGRQLLAIWEQRQAVGDAIDEDCDDEPFYVGDADLLPDVRAALALLPPVVRYAVIRETAFVAIVSSNGFTIPAFFVDAANRTKVRQVVLGPKADFRVILHEIAHVWTAEPPTENLTAITAQGEQGIRALADAQGWAHRIDGFQRRHERLADALAWSWLYHGARERPA